MRSLPSWTRDLEDLTDEAQAYVKSVVDQLRAMPAHCRPVRRRELLRPVPAKVSAAVVAVTASAVVARAAADAERMRRDLAHHAQVVEALARLRVPRRRALALVGKRDAC